MNNKPNISRFIWSFLVGLSLFGILWILIGPRVMDADPDWRFLFYGIAIYTGSQIICFCLREIVKTIRSKQNR